MKVLENLDLDYQIVELEDHDSRAVEAFAKLYDENGPRDGRRIYVLPGCNERCPPQNTIAEGDSAEKWCIPHYVNFCTNRDGCSPFLARMHEAMRGEVAPNEDIIRYKNENKDGYFYIFKDWSFFMYGKNGRARPYALWDNFLEFLDGNGAEIKGYPDDNLVKIAASNFQIQLIMWLNGHIMADDF